MQKIFRLASFGVLCSALTAWAGSYEYTFDFTPADVTLQATGVGETLVSLKDGDLGSGNPGKPWIPTKDFSIRLPEGEVMSSWTVELGETVLLEENIIPMPEQAPVPMSLMDQVTEPTPRDEEAYASVEPYPAVRGEHLTTGSMRGIKIASFRVAPVWYVGSEKKLYLASSVTIKVNTTRPRTTLGVSAPDYPSSDIFESAANSLVINPTAQTTRRSMLSVSPSGSGCQYLVITTEALKGPAERLANFRAEFDNKTAAVVTIEDIEASSAYSGLRPDGGTDVQTKIRNCIKWYVQNKGTEYVVLAGDDTVVPKRGVHAYVSGYDEPDAPSDLYYSDLDGDWDANKDGEYGYSSYRDSTDLYPDVIVGRIPVRTCVQLSDYVSKVIDYERNTTSDSDIVRKTLYLGYTLWEEMKRTSTGWDSYTSGSFDKLSFSFSETFGDGLLEITERKEGTWVEDVEVWCRRQHQKYAKLYRPNLRTSFSFGSTTSWDSATPGDFEQTRGLSGNISKTLNQGYHQVYVNCHGGETSYVLESDFWSSEAQELNNRADFIYVTCCYTGAFDYRDDPCLSEGFLRAKGGALGYIGCSRYGWGYKMFFAERSSSSNYWTVKGSVEGVSDKYAQEFWKRLYVNGDTKLGVAFAQHKAARASNGSSTTTDRWIQLLLNLQGDPLLTYHLPPANETNPRQSGKVGLVTLLRDNLPETKATSLTVRVAADEIPLGSSAVVALEYSKSSSFSSATTVVVDAAASHLGEYTKEITGLSADTTYYVRGKMTMDGVTHYSPFSMSFRTQPADYVSPTPVFSPAPCSFSSSLQVTLATQASDVTIRYTLDGSDPTADSCAYSTAIDIDYTTTFRAAAFRSGVRVGNVAEAVYTYAPEDGVLRGDSFTDPILLCGAKGEVIVSEVNSYTAEADERVVVDKYNPATVKKVIWFEWMAPGSGTVSLNSRLFMGDSGVLSSALVVYAGDSKATLQTLAEAGVAQLKPRPALSFTAQQGVTYRFAVLVVSTKPIGYSCRVSWSSDLTVGSESTVPSVRAPVLRPASCTFYPTTNVTMTCTTTGATIRYTTDGSEPTESSAVYSAPITLTTNVTLKARAFKSGMKPSLVCTAVYTCSDSSTAGPNGETEEEPDPDAEPGPEDKEVAWGDYKIAYGGPAKAQTKYSGTGDTVLVFTNGVGSFTLPAQARVQVLVVGGAGGGGGGYSPDDRTLYFGFGGNGGEVVEQELMLTNKSYVVRTGAGGRGGQINGDGRTGISSFLKTGSAVLVEAAAGAGGVSGEKGNTKGASGTAGTPSTGVTSTVYTGTYGRGALETANYAKDGDAGKVNTGMGGYGARGNYLGGAGGSGIVVIRILEMSGEVYDVDPGSDSGDDSNDNPNPPTPPDPDPGEEVEPPDPDEELANEVAWKTYKISYGGLAKAQTNYGGTTDTVLVFTNGVGAFSLPAQARAQILVVGGGGGAGGGYSSSSGLFFGLGGNGGGVEEIELLLTNKTYSVRVGQGGAGGDANGKSGGADGGQAGESSGLWAGTKSLVQAAGGQGGRGGETASQKGSSGSAGTPTAGLTSTIYEGTFGKGGRDTANVDKVGESGAVNSGEGGRGSRGLNAGGAGGSGIVVIRITDMSGTVVDPDPDEPDPDEPDPDEPDPDEPDPGEEIDPPDPDDELENEVAWKTYKIAYGGLATAQDNYGGTTDTVLVFTNGVGTFRLPAQAQAHILVVGGGGGAGGGYNSSSGLYFGLGGNGGEVKEIELLLTNKTYSVRVGQGGAGGDANGKAGGADGGQAGESSGLWTGTKSLVQAAGGQGGLGGETADKKGAGGSAGTPTTGLTSTIYTGTFGKGGRDTANVDKVGESGTANSGDGGRGSRGLNAGGAGGSGIVVIRITDLSGSVVDPDEPDPDDSDWDVPGTSGGINGITDGKGGKSVSFKAISLVDGKLKVDFEAGKVSANGQAFGLICKENLTDANTITINVTLKDDGTGSATLGSLEGLTNKSQLFILGIGPAN